MQTRQLETQPRERKLSDILHVVGHWTPLYGYVDGFLQKRRGTYPEPTTNRGRAKELVWSIYISSATAVTVSTPVIYAFHNYLKII